MSNDNFPEDRDQSRDIEDLELEQPKRGMPISENTQLDESTDNPVRDVEGVSFDEASERDEELVDPDLARGRGEGVGEATTEAESQAKIVRRRFFHHLGAMVGVATFICVALISLLSMGLGPIRGLYHNQEPLALHDVENDGAPTMHLPSWLGGHGGGWFTFGKYPFGQDELGHDNFAQVMAGIQTSLLVMIVFGIVVAIIGIVIGSLAGFYRGWIDTILMRLTDAVITLPVLVIGAVLGKLLATLPVKYNWPDSVQTAITNLMPLELALALGLIYWPSLARLLRAEVLSLREREFVDSARVAGASNFRIITRHVLPNATGIIIVNVTLLMSLAVVLETALSYLQFGISAPNVSLGQLISQYQSAFSTRPWLFWWPGLFIVLLALSVNFIGDGLRDAFDPRTKRAPSKRAMDAAFRARDAKATVAATTSTGAAQ